MFVGNCSGCFQVPSPMFYWSPYPTTSAFLKKPAFQISDILQVKNNLTLAEERILSKKHEGKFEEFNRHSGDYKTHPSRRASDARDLSKEVEMHEAINYSRKVDSARCTLPSALEPLQALCSTTPRVYGATSSGSESSHSIPSTSSSRDLKFGINRILAADFGKATQNKENSPRKADSITRSPRLACECTNDECHMYQRLGFPSAALSAVHALQPPRYPHSPSGTDTLPGPYSILNTEVNMLSAHSKRKRSWSRAVFSNLQRKGLEKRFEVQKYVTKPDRRQLAAMLGLTDAQVKVWFQNRRMKWRHAQQQTNELETETSPSDKPETEQVVDDLVDSIASDDANIEVNECDDSDSDLNENSVTDKTCV